MKLNSGKIISRLLIITLILTLLLPLTAASASDDNRLNPDHAEYYTIYCTYDNVDIYLANGRLLNRVLIARVLGLSSQGGSMSIGEGMTITRWSDTISVSGTNGNARPSAGTKTFSLRQCLDINGNTPAPVYADGTTGATGTSGTASNVTPPPSSCVHIVQRGETVYSLSKRYNTTVSAISSLNHLVPTRIYVGQHLTIPGCNSATTTSPPAQAAAAPIQTVSGQTHVLQSGQTLYSVARAYGVTVAALMRANGITDPTRVPAGMILQIP